MVTLKGECKMEENRNEMYIRIQDHTGDRRMNLSWVPEDDENAQAKIQEMMEDLQKQGYRFYTCKRVLGIFTKKGKEVERYDPELKELIYVKPNVTKTQIEDKNKTSVKIYEIETEEKVKHTEPKKYNPSKDKVDTSRDIVATKNLRAG